MNIYKGLLLHKKFNVLIVANCRKRFSGLMLFMFLACAGFTVRGEIQDIRHVGDLTFIVHYDIFDTLDEAKSACFSYLTSIGVSKPNCVWDDKNVAAGNYKEAGAYYVWHYLHYYYKKYNLAPDLDSCQFEANPCNVISGAKTQIETDYVSPNGLLKVTRTYSSDNLEGNYHVIYPYSDTGVNDDGVDDLGFRWKLDYSKRMDGEGELDVTHYYKPKSGQYHTPQEACESGWQSLRYKFPLLRSTTANYTDGLCNISNDQGIILKLVVYNTLDQKPASDSSNPIHLLVRPSGRRIPFLMSDNNWIPLYSNDSSLIQQGGVWSYMTSSGSVESYNDSGLLVRITNPSGQTISIDYDENNRIHMASDSYGNTLTYHFDENGHIDLITTPDGDLIYGYDTEGRLISVTYPDQRQRQYHYENSRYPYHLTGITDEKNTRFATWAYDDLGRAILSEHSNGAERVEFAYNSDGTTTVTDANGAERTYHFTVQQGQMKVDHIEGDRCATCANGGVKSYTYDANGFVASRTDWNGNLMTYTRDAQGRELSRTEGAGTPEARAVTTTWDAELNKPLVITEPDRVIEYHYTPEGRLLSREERPRS
ncbi:MAG: hypothetical protein ABW101_13985 [Candidatus Thiodiazotropha sp.]